MRAVCTAKKIMRECESGCEQVETKLKEKIARTHFCIVAIFSIQSAFFLFSFSKLPMGMHPSCRMTRSHQAKLWVFMASIRNECREQEEKNTMCIKYLHYSQQLCEISGGTSEYTNNIKPFNDNQLNYADNKCVSNKIITTKLHGVMHRLLFCIARLNTADGKTEQRSSNIE